MDIQGLSAIVTGGASGLGEATARYLAENGVKVTIFDMNTERGEQVASELGGQFFQVDVTSAESVENAIKAAEEKHGVARIAVSCAGIVIGQKTVGRENKPHDLDAFQKVITVNLIGTFNIIRLAAARMAEQEPLENGERGVLVNTASIAAYDGQIGQVAYAASKGGVVGLTLPVARDLSKLGIRICTIAPGIFGTPMMLSMPQEVQDALGATVPFPSRLGYPEEFAKMVQTICENPMLNGETIRLDGALRMPPK